MANTSDTRNPASAWHPDQFARRKANLDVRQRVIVSLRGYFAAEDFAEVETPILQTSPGGEVHLQAFATELKGPRGEAAQKLYLHTSPELAMKKLLVAGVPRLYQLARVFRNGERSPLHHPEFLMCEWYRSEGSGVRDQGSQKPACHPCESGDPAARSSERKNNGGTNGDRGESLTRRRALLDSRFRGNDSEGLIEAIREDCVELVRAAATAGNRKIFSANNMVCDPFKEWERLSVPEAFQRYAGIDLLATTPDPHKPDVKLLAIEAKRIGVRVSDGDTWDDLFFRIMGEKIEPYLGTDRPTFLCDYPLSMAALARPKAEDPRLAERFELYICGIELANAFGELTDADEQQRRLIADMALKQKLYGESWPVDEDFIAALRLGMPPSAGIALGVDRLVMLCAGAEHIEDVLWLPVACARPTSKN